MDDVIGVGVLGLGNIGGSHALALGQMRGRVQLRAFSGGSGEAAAGAGWPEAEQVSFDELLARDDISVVAVCTPSGSHGRLALAALAAGKHVVIEKPMALSVSEAEEIVARAAQAELTVSVMSQRRLEPEVVAVRTALEQGSLGAVRLATTHVHWWRDEDYYSAAAWRRDAADGGGSLLNQGVHNVDLLQWFAGPVQSVTAQQASLVHGPGAEDTTVATVRFVSGALGLISTSTATPPGTAATLTIHTDRGVVEVGQGEIVRWQMDGVPRPHLNRAPGRIGVGASDPTAIGYAGHVQQWTDILDAITSGGSPSISGQDGAATVRLLVAIHEAARTGRCISPAALS